MSEEIIEARSAAVSQMPSKASPLVGSWGFLVGSVLLSATAQVFLKAGAMAGNSALVESDAAWQIFFQPMVIAGLALYGMGTLLWLKCLTRVDLSVAYLVSALQYVLIFAAARAIFDESLSPTRLCGLTVILVGIVIVSRKRSPSS